MKFITITLSILLLNLAAEATDRSTEQLLATIGNNHETPVIAEQLQTLSHQEYIQLAQIENTNEGIREYELNIFQPSMLYRTSQANDLHIDARINMELPYTIGGIISGNLKWGRRYKQRDYDRQTFGVRNGDPYFGLVIRDDKLIPKEDGSPWNDDINIPAEHIDQNNILLGSYLLIGELEEMRSTIYKLKGNMKY